MKSVYTELRNCELDRYETPAEATDSAVNSATFVRG